MSLVCELFGAITDGISKAAERLCPMDHTGERRAQAVCDAAEAAEDEPSRVVGLRHADSSGEVGDAIPETSPSPERPTSDLLYEAAVGLEWFIEPGGSQPPSERCQRLIAELRDRGALFTAIEELK